MQFLRCKGVFTKFPKKRIERVRLYMAHLSAWSHKKSLATPTKTPAPHLLFPPAPPPPPPQHSASTPASSVSFSPRVSGVVCRRRWRWQSPWKESRRVRGRSGWTSPPSIWTPSPSRPARTSASSGRRHAPPLGVPILRKH